MFTTQLGEDILQAILEGTPIPDYSDWDISLHTADPEDAGDHEVAAGGNAYARQAPSFGAVSGKTATTDADLEWVNMPAVTVTHVGLWGYVTDTWYFIWGGELLAPKVVGAGDTFKIAAGDLDVELDPA